MMVSLYTTSSDLVFLSTNLRSASKAFFVAMFNRLLFTLEGNLSGILFPNGQSIVSIKIFFGNIFYRPLIMKVLSTSTLRRISSYNRNTYIEVVKPKEKKSYKCAVYIFQGNVFKYQKYSNPMNT